MVVISHLKIFFCKGKQNKCNIQQLYYCFILHLKWFSNVHTIHGPLKVNNSKHS